LQIKELIVEQFRTLMCEVVIEVLEEYIDLDEGKKLKSSVVDAKNAGMYLGRQSVSNLFVFLAGYEFLRSQISKQLTEAEEDFYNEFQPWLQ